MKLNVKRTILIGFAFLSICAFWQMYNKVIPLILTNTFHLNESLSGVIMAADNVLALFLLPAFGALSDRSTSRFGRRMPFIVLGTAAATSLMMLLPVLDNSYASVHAGWKIAAFVGVLLAVLVAMGTYRSPAVALMPDLTPKPARSQANAIINLMGAIGGIVYLVIAAVLYPSSKTEAASHVDYLPLFAIVAIIMVGSAAIVATTIRERRIAAEVAELEGDSEEVSSSSEDPEHPASAFAPEVRRSMTFLLISIALWFIGYNALETWFTTYAQAEWSMGLGDASRCLIVGTAGAIVSYIPVGIIAGKIGRKRSILAGIILLFSSFAAMAAWTFAGGGFSPVLYVLMVVLGMGWAAINVNSLPMVVEMCHICDVGRFTGYYYTFSMAAQTVSPIVAGWVMHNISYRALFVYSAIFVAASFITMCQVHHGDTQGFETKRGLEAFEDMGD